MFKTITKVSTCCAQKKSGIARAFKFRAGFPLHDPTITIFVSVNNKKKTTPSIYIYKYKFLPVKKDEIGVLEYFHAVFYYYY